VTARGEKTAAAATPATRCSSGQPAPIGRLLDSSELAAFDPEAEHHQWPAYNASHYRISVAYDLAKAAVKRLAFSQGHELAPYMIAVVMVLSDSNSNPHSNSRSHSGFPVLSTIAPAVDSRGAT
jgi:hypothetical protein